MEEKISWGLTLAAATLIVGAALYAILDAAAPMGSGPVPKKAVPQEAHNNTRPQITQPQRQQDHSTAGQIYRCNFNGSTIYSDAPCPGAKVVDVRVSEGFLLARPGSHSVQATRLVQVDESSRAQTVAQPAASGNAGQCAVLADALKSIDEAARRGQTAVSQDRLREDRRAIVERMYALKC